MSQPVQTTSPALILTAKRVVLTTAAAAAAAAAAAKLRALRSISCALLSPATPKGGSQEIDHTDRERGREREREGEGDRDRIKCLFSQRAQGQADGAVGLWGRKNI